MPYHMPAEFFLQGYPGEMNGIPKLVAFELLSKFSSHTCANSSKLLAILIHHLLQWSRPNTQAKIAIFSKVDVQGCSHQKLCGFELLSKILIQRTFKILKTAIKIALFLRKMIRHSGQNRHFFLTRHWGLLTSKTPRFWASLKNPHTKIYFFPT